MNSFEQTLLRQFRVALFQTESHSNHLDSPLPGIVRDSTKGASRSAGRGSMTEYENFIFPGMHSKILANVKTLTIRGPITYIYKILNSEGISSITGRPEEISQIKSQLKKTLLNHSDQANCGFGPV